MPRSIFRVAIIQCGVWLIVLASARLIRADESAKPRHPIARGDSATRPTSGSSTSSTGFWLSSGGIAAALAVFGVYSLTAKKVRPTSESPAIRVIGRTSLSARQSIYLVRVGERTLILGTGSQGPPTLLGELPELNSAEPSPNATPRAALTRIGAGV